MSIDPKFVEVTASCADDVVRILFIKWEMSKTKQYQIKINSLFLRKIRTTMHKQKTDTYKYVNTKCILPGILYI